MFGVGNVVPTFGRRLHGIARGQMLTVPEPAELWHAVLGAIAPFRSDALLLFGGRAPLRQHHASVGANDAKRRRLGSESVNLSPGMMQPRGVVDAFAVASRARQHLGEATAIATVGVDTAFGWSPPPNVSRDKEEGAMSSSDGRSITGPDKRTSSNTSERSATPSRSEVAISFDQLLPHFRGEASGAPPLAISPRHGGYFDVIGLSADAMVALMQGGEQEAPRGSDVGGAEATMGPQHRHTQRSEGELSTVHGASSLRRFEAVRHLCRWIRPHGVVFAFSHDYGRLETVDAELNADYDEMVSSLTVRSKAGFADAVLGSQALVENSSLRNPPLIPFERLAGDPLQRRLRSSFVTEEELNALRGFPGTALPFANVTRKAFDSEFHLTASQLMSFVRSWRCYQRAAVPLRPWCDDDGAITTMSGAATDDADFVSSSLHDSPHSPTDWKALGRLPAAGAPISHRCRFPRDHLQILEQCVASSEAKRFGVDRRRREEPWIVLVVRHHLAIWDNRQSNSSRGDRLVDLSRLM